MCDRQYNLTDAGVSFVSNDALCHEVIYTACYAGLLLVAFTAQRSLLHPCNTQVQSF